MSAWLIASCAKDGGPHPEVPAPDAGAGSGGNGGGAGGADAGAGAGGGGSGGFSMETGGGGGVAGMSMTGGAGGMSAGGVGGMNAVTGCTDSDAPLGSSAGATFSPAEALEKGTAIGTNGTFEDACDEHGDLIEHTCETMFTCSGAGSGAGEDGFAPCAPRDQPTGMAVQHLVDCFGMCVDGACEVPCPAPNDPLTVTSADTLAEQYELDPGIEGLRYVCSRMCDSPAPSVGDVLTVRSIAAPDDTRLDCRELFSDTENPLLLSDGCSYVGCSARRPSTP